MIDFGKDQFKSLILQQIKSAGKKLAENTGIFPTQVVYCDYDVVCLRTLRGQHTTFQIRPDIDMDQFIEEFNFREYLKFYTPQKDGYLVMPLLTHTAYASLVEDDNFDEGIDDYDEEKANRSESRSAYLGDVAEAHNVSVFEMAALFKNATRALLSSFNTRLGKETRRFSYSKNASPCA